MPHPPRGREVFTKVQKSIINSSPSPPGQTIPLVRMEAPWLGHVLRATPPNTVLVGLKFKHDNFLEGKTFKLFIMDQEFKARLGYRSHKGSAPKMSRQYWFYQVIYIDTQKFPTLDLQPERWSILGSVLRSFPVWTTGWMPHYSLGDF